MRGLGVVALLLAAVAQPGAARAESGDIVVGVSIGTTGPAAALGIPERNALEFVPKQIGGFAIKTIVLDDGGDAAAATANARRLVGEARADILIGSSTTAPALAIAAIAQEAGIPHFSLAPLPFTPQIAKWSVAMPPPVPLVGEVLYLHMKAHHVRTVGYLGFADGYGDQWYADLKAQGVPLGFSIVNDERFSRSDTSVAAQAAKLVVAHPDAILVGASGTAAAMPQIGLRDAGYKGLIYQTHGAAVADFIRIAGAAADGVVMASGPVMDPEGQPDSAPTKKPGLMLNEAYESKYGPNSRSAFAGYASDVFVVLKRVVPVALQTAKPGTAEFRDAVRAALLTEREIAASQGVYNFTATDRFGLDARARILLTVKDGKFVAAE
ncbi:MAG TPA: ABC transporter substrate-binding protein [Rhodopseudomonas sp.]|uniref:ABC transporter substrate-binding protein n=1 Tax=Rhodopseudomonas sp. TaxID=1078 RepID=UPI002ED7B7CF